MQCYHDQTLYTNKAQENKNIIISSGQRRIMCNIKQVEQKGENTTIVEE